MKEAEESQEALEKALVMLREVYGKAVGAESAKSNDFGGFLIIFIKNRYSPKPYSGD